MKKALGRGFGSLTAPRASNVVSKISGFQMRGPGIKPEAVRSVLAPGDCEILGVDGPGGSSQVASFHVPIPPSVNRLYRSQIIKVNRGGKPMLIPSVYLTHEGQDWKKAASLLFASAGIVFDKKAKVVVEARAFWPDLRDRDMNNLAKIVCDALQASGMVLNDKRVLWREMDFALDRERPRLRLDVYLAEGAP